MEEIIKKLDNTSSLLNIKPIIEYLSAFENYEVLETNIDEEMGNISLLCNGEIIAIYFINVKYARWWSIYKYHEDDTIYEQIDAILFNEKQEASYNRMIKFAGHIEDDNYSYLTVSCYSYLDDKFIRSWKHIRKIKIEDLNLVQYSKHMNLTELISLVDHDMKNIEVLERHDSRNTKLKLKLEKN